MNSVVGYEYKPAAHLRVTDEDAADFLQSQFSNELRPFDAGRMSYGMWLNVKGKVIGDSVILCEGKEHFRLLSEQTASATIVEKLERHIIADDVEIEKLSVGAGLTLIGEGVQAVLNELKLGLPTVDHFVESAELRIWNGRRSQELNVELWSQSESVIEELKERLIGLGVCFVKEREVQLTRIAAGIVSVPSEIGPNDLPGEGGLVGDAVSLTKGCYLGQEVVARMHNLGRPQRGLFRIYGTGEVPVCPVALYNDASKQIGELRTVVVAENSWQGVALLKVRHALVGDYLHCSAGTVKIDSLFTAIEALGN